jgi:hypothetical protein
MLVTLLTAVLIGQSSPQSPMSAPPMPGKTPPQASLPQSAPPAPLAAPAATVPIQLQLSVVPTATAAPLASLPQMAMPAATAPLQQYTAQTCTFQTVQVQGPLRRELQHVGLWLYRLGQPVSRSVPVGIQQQTYSLQPQYSAAPQFSLPVQMQAAPPAQMFAAPPLPSGQR